MQGSIVPVAWPNIDDLNLVAFGFRDLGFIGANGRTGFWLDLFGLS